MRKKVGRNDPCPCGSGKKYKKCCGVNQSEGGFIQRPDNWIPDSERTGTLFDEYMELIPAVAIYAKKIIQFDEDGQELDKAFSDFEKQFRPGEKGGIIDSFFISWMYFDFRFGTGLETVGERLLSDPQIRELNEPGPTYLRHLNESYLTFFEIIEESEEPDTVTVEELGTGKRFTVFHVRELFEIVPVVREIWFARRVGFPESSIFYTTPYIFNPESRLEFKRIVTFQKKDFSRSSLAELFPPKRHFAESQKETALFWAWYILKGSQLDQTQIREEDLGQEEEDISFGHFPTLVTTDGEELILTEMHFRIQDEEALRKRFSSLRSFQYEKRGDSWTWLKAKSRKYPEKPRTVLGHFRIEGGYLIAETNSKERAARLRSKLKRHLGHLIAYEKTLYRDPYDFPELSPEEREAQEKKSEELNARPEVQRALRKYLENYYYKEWPSMKISALDGLTPLQAGKKDKYRAKVIALLDEFEKRQESPLSKMPKIDLDRLRRKLGLPPKAN